MLGQILRELPDTRVILLLRGDAQQRLENEVLDERALRGPRRGQRDRDLRRRRRRSTWPSPAASTSSSTARASVSFEQSLDEALELNGKGPARLLQAVRDAGSDPYFVHVSTAYAAGARTGLVLEKPSGTAPSEPWLDLDAELDAAKAWRRDIEAESRLPVHQHRFVKEATRAIGPPAARRPARAPRSSATSGSASSSTERGRERARALGWSDTYTLSKAIGERTLMAANPRLLTIVRPAIVESALHTPYPGWMESLKVADPILLGYGAGIIPGRFAANRSIRMDLIPVDFVANACLAAAAHPPAEGTIRTMNVSTGMRNPLTINDMAVITTRYFRDRPIPDEDGLPVAVPEWRFSTRAEIMTALNRADDGAREGPQRSSTASRSRAATRSSCGCTRTSASSTACAG